MPEFNNFCPIFADMDVMQFYVCLLDPDGKPLFKCTLCNLLTKSKWNMKRHMMIKHTEATNEPCQYCNRLFKNQYYLNNHISSRECLSKMKFNPNRASR